MDRLRGFTIILYVDTFHPQAVLFGRWKVIVIVFIIVFIEDSTWVGESVWYATSLLPLPRPSTSKIIPTVILSWNELTWAVNMSGQPNFAVIFRKSSPLPVSKALVRSTKIEQRSQCCSWHRHYVPSKMDKRERYESKYKWSATSLHGPSIFSLVNTGIRAIWLLLWCSTLSGDTCTDNINCC